MAIVGATCAMTATAQPAAAQPAAAQPAATSTAQQWLEAMDEAFRELDYDGVFSYYTVNRTQQFSQSSRAVNGPKMNGAAALTDAEREEASFAHGERRVLGFGGGYRSMTRLATFRVVHKVVDGVERERIVHLNGPPREILRVGDEVAYVLKSNDELLALDGVAPASPYDRVFGRQFENMSNVYQVHTSGRCRVAARPAVLLSVTPRYQDRFGYRLWVDEETGLLLRSELKDSEGTDLEIFQFTSLHIGDDVAEGDLQPSTEDVVVRRLSETAAAPAIAPNWQARWVPPGFQLTSATVQPRPGKAAGVNTLVFSDGLAALSVFIETMPEAGAGTVVSRNGGTVVLTHSTTGDDGDHLVTVVGEVPVATARRVAAGVFQTRQ